MEKSLDLNNFDNSESPGKDFNKYVNGTWLKENKIPEKYSKWGTFEILHEENLDRLNKIIKNSDGKLKYIYDEFMNVDKLETLDSSVIDKYINGILNCENKSELWKLLGDYYKLGIVSIFGFYPGEDAKDSINVVPHLHSGGLGLPDRDYYFDDDKEEIRNKYINYLESMWELYHMKSKKLDHVFALEKKLANVIFTRVEKRDPHKSYNKMTISELKEICNLDWETYFSKLIIRDIPFIIVDNKDYYKKFYDLWTQCDMEIWQDYLITKVISNFSSYMSDRFFENKFNFYSKELSGQKVPKPRWERAVGVVNSNLGELLGRKYVEKYFPQSSKDKMLEMVKKLQDELRERILSLSLLIKLYFQF